MAGLGSIMYLVRNVGNAIQQGASNFGLDNSMIKRLYSLDREIEGHKIDINEEDNEETGRQELIDTLEKRSFWDYRWKTANCAPKGYCFLRCFCCKPKTRYDKLFLEARKTLHQEIDLL